MDDKLHPFMGKGYWAWKIRYCEGGDPKAIARVAKESGYSHVVMKIADGEESYNIGDDGVDLAKALVKELHAVGIYALGWHYLYAYDPEGEAGKGVERVAQTGVDGYVMDVEYQYKNCPDETEEFTNELARLMPSSIPIAMCSYRYPSLHREISWNIWKRVSDVNMPQVYWEGQHNPLVQLVRSIHEYEEIGWDNIPMFPVGSAYKRGEWEATSADVVEFLEAAESNKLGGASFWEWAHTKKHLLHVWETIQEYEWQGETPPEPPPGDDMSNFERAIEQGKIIKEEGLEGIILIYYSYEDEGDGNGGNGNGDPGNGNGNGGNGDPYPKPVGNEWHVLSNFVPQKAHVLVFHSPKDNKKGYPELEIFEFEKGNTDSRIKIPNGTLVVTGVNNIQVDGGAGFIENRARELLWADDDGLNKQIRAAQAMVRDNILYVEKAELKK